MVLDGITKERRYGSESTKYISIYNCTSLRDIMVEGSDFDFARFEEVVSRALLKSAAEMGMFIIVLLEIIEAVVCTDGWPSRSMSWSA